MTTYFFQREGLRGPGLSAADTTALQGYVDDAEAAQSGAEAAQAGAETAAGTAQDVLDGIAGLGTKGRSLYTVPAIGNYAEIRMRLDGNGIVSTRSFAEPVGKQSYIVPRIGSATGVVLGANGITDMDSADADSASASVGDVEVREATGSPDGRAVNQLFLRLHEGVFVPLSYGPFAIELVSASPGVGMAQILRQGETKELTWRTTRIGSALRARPRKLRLIVILSQSLGQGHTDTAQEPVPPWRAIVAERAFMFDSSGFDGLFRGPRVLQVAPIQSNREVVADDAQFAKIVQLQDYMHAMDGNRAQTICATAAAALHGQHMAWEDETLWCVVGTGSTAISYFQSPAAHFQTMQKAIAAAAARVAAYNAMLPGTMELEVVSVSQQGEEDNSLGTTQAAFVAAYQDVIADLGTEVTGAGGTYVGHIIVQCMQNSSNVVGMATYGQAELVRGGDAWAVPVYPMLPGGNSTHLWPFTYLPLGSAVAYAIAEILDGNNPTPFVADGDAVLTSATTTECTISNGSGTFVFDTDTIPDKADLMKGVTMEDDGGALAISGLSLAGNVLTITHAATTIGDNPKVELGMKGQGQLPNSLAPRVNIRDDSAFRCGATGQIVSGWLLAHEVALAAA